MGLIPLLAKRKALTHSISILHPTPYRVEQAPLVVKLTALRVRVIVIYLKQTDPAACRDLKDPPNPLAAKKSCRMFVKEGLQVSVVCRAGQLRPTMPRFLEFYSLQASVK